LSWEEERVVQRDWTVAWQGRWFQIESGHEALCLVGRSVIVRELRNGAVQLIGEKQKLKYRELTQRPVRALRPKQLPKAAAPQSKPEAGHPWRQFGSGVGQEFWRGVKARGQAARRSALPSTSEAGQAGKKSQRPSEVTEPGARLSGRASESVTRGDRRKRELEFRSPFPPLTARPNRRRDAAKGFLKESEQKKEQKRGHFLLS